MSAYITQYCAIHGEWDMDVDNVSECRACDKEGKLPIQIVTRQRDELLRAAKIAYDYMLSRGVARGSTGLKNVISRIEAEIGVAK